MCLAECAVYGNLDETGRSVKGRRANDPSANTAMSTQSGSARRTIHFSLIGTYYALFSSDKIRCGGTAEMSYESVSYFKAGADAGLELR